MNQWGNEQYNIMPHLIGPTMGPGPNMGPPALLPTPMLPGPPGPGMVPPLVPPSFLMNEWNQGNQSENSNGPRTGQGQFIDQVVSNKPDVDLTKDDDRNSDNEPRNRSFRDNRDSARDRRDGDRDRDRGRRPRSPYNRNSRESRDRNDRSRGDRRERRGAPRWGDTNDNIQTEELMGNNVMTSGNNIMQYGNIMGQQPIDMANVMPNMSNMIPGMNIMPNMISNMMDQNMMMMQQVQMNMNSSNQPIYISNGVLLPPLPNISMPSRRECPAGCRTIFVSGLPHGIQEHTIREIFERCGLIDEVKILKQGVCHVRFNKHEQVEHSFFLSGSRYKTHHQMESEATTLFIDYALNRDDQFEYERMARRLAPSPPRLEPYTPAAFTALSDKIKSDTDFSDAAPTLAGWLERGECNKKNANSFYSLIQASNNQMRRLYSEKMAIDEEFQAMKSTLKDKFAHIISQFEQVGKILTAAKIQRVSDHFSKQQRRSIDMWLKMTEDVENMKEEFNAMFDEDENDDKGGKGNSILKKYEELKVENENLHYELEGYKNEAHLAKDEAERKFEKFKAHFIAQQALQNKQSGPMFQPMPTSVSQDSLQSGSKQNSEKAPTTAPPSDAKLISVLTAFLLVHPFGASLDYLVSYVKSIIPTSTQAAVHDILQKYSDVFTRKTTGVGANIESRWTFVTYDIIKKEVV